LAWETRGGHISLKRRSKWEERVGDCFRRAAAEQALFHGGANISGGGRESSEANWMRGTWRQPGATMPQAMAVENEYNEASHHQRANSSRLRWMRALAVKSKATSTDNRCQNHLFTARCKRCTYTHQCNMMSIEQWRKEGGFRAKTPVSSFAIAPQHRRGEFDPTF
jgi:hypothetical protein